MKASSWRFRALLLLAADAAGLGILWLLSRQRAGTTIPPYAAVDGAAEVEQVLAWGEWIQRRRDPATTAYANTGRQLYVIGDIDGGFRPRSNVYDLYTFGAPQPGDPLAEELQGVWAQPVKALDGYLFVVEVGGERHPLYQAQRFSQTFATAAFDFALPAGLRATRTDFAAQDRPALFTMLALQNDGDSTVAVNVNFYAYFDLEDAWFTSLADERNQRETLELADDVLIARAASAPEAWAVAVGAQPAPAALEATRGVGGQRVGRMGTSFELVAGASASWTVGVVVEAAAGPEQALRNLADWLPLHDALLVEKQALYEALLADGPRLVTPDERFNRAFDVARANLQLLEAEPAALGRYFYAGLEMFPFWFCSELAYSLPGLLAAGLVETAGHSLTLGPRFAADGGVPHQISPAGHMTAPGNAQETAQWVSAVWDYYRWTGDRELMAQLYPDALAGMFDYSLGRIDGDGDRFPEGPAMVEREGMGPEKVDSASYVWRALVDLAQLADELNDSSTAERARSEAAALQATFDDVWWLPDTQVYADSLLHPANEPRSDGHWTAAVPMEVGLASPENAQAALARIAAERVNEWGLVHTASADDRVWTLPTATLSRGAYRYGESGLGFAMLQNLSLTLEHGSIGLYHELIPEGLSFLQLWSAATFVRGAIEDLMGVKVRADGPALDITPQLPAGWAEVTLEKLRFGDHLVTIQSTPGALTVDHLEGSAPIEVTYRAGDGTEQHFSVPAGERASARGN